MSVYGLSNGTILPLGRDAGDRDREPLAQPGRASADFDGDGDVEIAYVETPHIGVLLCVLSL